MSRSGYDYDGDNWDLIRWRGAVNSAIRGRRGQRFLRELVEALDALAERELIADELEADGAYCALGAVGARRGIPLADLDPYDRERVAEVFGIAPALAAEVMFMNDEIVWQREKRAERWALVRDWAARMLREGA